MEVHVVNMIEPKAPEDPPRYLVMSFLYKMGAEDTFIASFLDHVPKEAGGEELEPGTVELIRRSELEYEYYHYRGSLTTPPHTESVHWLVLKQVMKASAEQIRRINAIEGDNARHVQALYGRPIDD